MSGGRFDALVIGAGFSGLYALHRLRELGLRAVHASRGPTTSVAPGCSTATPAPAATSRASSTPTASPTRSSRSGTGPRPCRPSRRSRRYLNFVADRLDLRRDIRFGTTVVAMTFDEDAATWTLDTDDGRVVRRAVRHRGHGHPVGAAGTRHRRAWTPSRATSLFTSRFPREGFDFSRQAGRRHRHRFDRRAGRSRSSPSRPTTSTCSSARPPTRCRANSAAVRARRVRRAAGPLPRDPRRRSAARSSARPGLSASRR